MDFLDKIKKELRPDISVISEIDASVIEINKKLKNKRINAECVPGGSVAKGTFLKNDFDVDLFVKFNLSYKDKNISDMLKDALEGYNLERIHGSRDYFHMKKENLNYEIVPVLDVKDPKDAVNVTDMSPMHVNWVKKHLKKGQEDEIRLTKKFCKAAGVYGAESYIRGFSGHVIDILIIYYGSFMELAKNAYKWKKQEIIDTEHHYRNSRDILFSMNQSKINGPLIVVDPILKTRNAASAMSYEKFLLFKKKAAAFLKKPSEIFFTEENIGVTYLKNKYKKNLLILHIEAKEGKTDVIGSKVEKAFRFMKSELVKLGFIIKNSGWTWNKKKKALYWFTFDNFILPETKIIEGPFIEMKEHYLIFKEKYGEVFEEKGKLFAKIKVKMREASENIEILASKEYFKEKVKLSKIEKYK